MSKEYDLYLKEHIRNVERGLNWLLENVGEEKIRDILPGLRSLRTKMFIDHDISKFGANEYVAYDAYFYSPSGVKSENGVSEKVQKDFNYAWLNHIHANPHHWQHWVLVNDDKELGCVALEMPDRYILEMICDWWAFSWAKGDLYEIFNWWNEHSDYILLAPETREKALGMLRLILDKVNELGGEVEKGEGSEE